jgi:predicted flap endonuclease-1-like 5' DNA nuclease
VTPAPAEQVDVAQPAVPLPGDLAGIAFPPGATDHTDELTRLKGVGPKLEAMLNDLGVTRFEQLASMSEEDLAALDARLGAFAGRLQRDRVAEQARYLASGDTAGFEATFGKLG